MSDEKSQAGESSDLRFEAGTAERRASPDVQPNVGLSVAVVVGRSDPKPELALLVAANASQCSEDPAETAEAAYLGRLEPEAAMLFKTHLEACPPCRQKYEETVEFVVAISAVAKSLRFGDCSKVN